MLHDAVPKGPDRRRSPRFPLPIGRVSGGQNDATLLNISRQGMAIEVPVATGFSRGDSQRFTLQDLQHSVEVKGRVQWVRSDWRDHAGPGRVSYIQVVGVTFEEIMTPEPSGIWSNLQSIGAEGEDVVPEEEDSVSASSRTVSVSSPEPPSLMEPLDGVSTVDPKVTVICRIAIPGEVTGVSINGVRAILEGGQAKADIDLDPGINRLGVLIWRDDGSYRSYSLGSVTRKEPL